MLRSLTRSLTRSLPTLPTLPTLSHTLPTLPHTLPPTRMKTTTTTTHTFPTITIPNHDPTSPPVEISLLSQLVHGSGSRVFDSVSVRQARHPEFVDELDEPSSKLGNVDLEKNDATSLYTFTVDGGHPFHRHEGHRVVVGVAGAGGTLLSFSSLPDPEDGLLALDPQAFVDAMHVVRIPADALFTMRFDGKVWHRFSPATPGHPAFTAISTHTNELGGSLDPETRSLVAGGGGTIAALTQLAPPQVMKLLESAGPVEPGNVTTLSLEPLGAAQDAACSSFRASMGSLWRVLPRSRGAGWALTTDAVDRAGKRFRVTQLDSPEELIADSIMDKVLEQADHVDAFSVDLAPQPDLEAPELLALALEGFLENRPPGVGWMMWVRNALVSPLRLRTSPLGCPVSSLLGPAQGTLFDNRFPVHGSRIDRESNLAEVILGADDKHVSFRTLVRIDASSDPPTLTLANRVFSKNLFGKLYMAIIDSTHRRYVAPELLRHAAAYLTHLQSPVQ